MKKCFFLLTILFLAANFQSVFGQDFDRPSKTDYPALPPGGKSVEDFVPENWAVVRKACGDLNGDRLEDCALVVKANYGRFLNKNEGLGSDPFDTNPRILAILFKEKNGGFKLAVQSNTFIVPPDAPNMEDPFQEIAVRQGILRIDFSVFYNAGSWSTSNYSYKFRLQKGEFVLVGADRTEAMRNTGEMETQSYNFLTNRVRIARGNFTEDKKDKVHWKTFRVGKLKTFDTFKAPFTWEIDPNHSL